MIEDHAMACAIYGDCIFDLVQEGAKTLQSRWETSARPWEELLDKAVRTGFLGWGSPLVNRDWLSFLLFRPREWPSGLTSEEQALLRMAIAASGFNRRYRKGPAPEKNPNLGRGESEANALEALKRYAALFKSQIAIPMYKDYAAVSSEYGRKIQPLCGEKYNEPCSVGEAEEIFKGDLRRGHQAKTLDVDPATYRVLPQFWRWVSA